MLHGIRWIFFDVGSTLVDEAVTYDHRIQDMIKGTTLTFEEVDAKRMATFQPRKFGEGYADVIIQNLDELKNVFEG